MPEDAVFSGDLDPSIRAVSAFLKKYSWRFTAYAAVISQSDSRDERKKLTVIYSIMDNKKVSEFPNCVQPAIPSGSASH